MWDTNAAAKGDENANEKTAKAFKITLSYAWWQKQEKHAHKVCDELKQGQRCTKYLEDSTALRYTAGSVQNGVKLVD